MQTGGKSDDKSRRLRERFALHLPVRVYCRESLDHEWNEMSRLLDVTHFGARLTLKRPTEPGRLLHLTLPMPRPLRVFDHVEDQYRVWSLVRNLKLLDPKAARGALVEIGVAFVGKRPPRSFETDPARRYGIAHSSDEVGLAALTEDTGEQLSEVFVNDKRIESRLNIPVDMLVQVFDEKGELSQGESSVTDNISLRGAAVFTSLDISPGRFVKLTSQQYKATVLAVVRGRRTGADGIKRLHLEFVGSEWPL